MSLTFELFGCFDFGDSKKAKLKNENQCCNTGFEWKIHKIYPKRKITKLKPLNNFKHVWYVILKFSSRILDENQADLLNSPT